VGLVVKRFDVFLINLDPTIGREIKKTRPCLVVSPKFRRKQGQVVLDQIRTVDKTRLVQELGKVDNQTQAEVLSILGEMFAP